MDLEINQFTGPVPASVASMASLQRLDLLNNAFTGLLPPLPWPQYSDGCWLNGNNFSCPLPPGAVGNCTGFPKHGNTPPTCSVV